MQSHPSHPNYSQLGFKVHPPNPPQGGLSCSLLPFAVQYLSNQISQQSTTEMDWCRVVGPRGLCRPLDEKQVSNKQPGPRATRRANTGQGRAGQGRAAQRRAGQGRAGQGAGQGRAPESHRVMEFLSLQTFVGVPPKTPPKSTDDPKWSFGVLLYCRTAKSFAGRRYSPRIPGGFTLPHHLVVGFRV